ncbi:MAG TPA: transglutaminase-like domain-containing protein [Candidatus Methylomirabilis sp.]|nr:transglutaminase-like domain-containing protein [Candidatus Methylomirabilis sp.]
MLAGLLAVFLYWKHDAKNPPGFHDMRVFSSSSFISLVDPRDTAVRSLAEQLRTPEAAYLYVRDRIRYVPMMPTESPGKILRGGSASCLGKAALLCSLYRAMGIPPSNVRIVTGNVALGERLADHAWIDLEYKGACLQQDPSGFLGMFHFAQFPGMEFTRFFVQEEDFCFNDKEFAVISQLNRFRQVVSGGS